MHRAMLVAYIAAPSVPAVLLMNVRDACGYTIEIIIMDRWKTYFPLGGVQLYISLVLNETTGIENRKDI